VRGFEPPASTSRTSTAPLPKSSRVEGTTLRAPAVGDPGHTAGRRASTAGLDARPARRVVIDAGGLGATAARASSWTWPRAPLASPRPSVPQRSGSTGPRESGPARRALIDGAFGRVRVGGDVDRATTTDHRSGARRCTCLAVGELGGIGCTSCIDADERSVVVRTRAETSATLPTLPGCSSAEGLCEHDAVSGQ
jgi:hypothetical protein